MELGADVARVWWWGRAVLAAGLAAGIALAILLAAFGPVWAPLVPAGIAIGGLALGALSRSPYGHLCAVMTVFALSIGYEEGVQPLELVFAIYYATFLAHWYGTRLFVYRERIVRNVGDAALAFFLVYVTCSVVLTVVFRGDPSAAFSDWINFSYFAFYFPIREACERERSGPWVVAAILVVLGVFAAVQNLIMLNQAYSDATQAWQVARGRVPMNEMPLLAGAIVALTGALTVRSIPARLALIVVFSVLVGALIIAQSRAYYVDFVLALVLLVAFAGRGQRARLTAGILVGVGGLVALAFLLFRDYASLVGLGLLDRALSIGTATSDDISLINRFSETRAAWELVRANPIVGYGIGTTFGFYDAISDATWVKPYVHNGFVMLWFKFGIVGLAAVLIVWVQAIARGLRSRLVLVEANHRRLALATGVLLIAIIPSHFSAATFTTGDTTMTFTILCGLANGLAGRRWAAGTAPEAEALSRA